MANISKYISESFSELKERMTWPKWPEVQKYTIIIAIFAVVVSFIIWGVDKFFGYVLSVVRNLIEA